MSLNNSLPSFNETFNSLIPSSRKRSNDDHIRVKDESDDDEGAPPPSALMPSPLKKRRVTVSGGAPHPLNIDVRPPPDQTSSTPISPVVMGFTIQRDNPSAIEQVRSMITVKQKQKALIEQRRGSAAGIMSPVSENPPSRNTPRRHPPSPPQQQQQQQQQQQPTPAPAPPQPQHSLPPPPISFARRRAAVFGGKKKPADIVISPREAHTRDQLQPAIQSAPPIPQAGGQSSFYTSARFQMALPRLPNISGDNPRRVASNVPPTPTRLSTSLALQQEQRGPFVQQIHNSSINTTTTNNRSPPAPSVPISHSATLVPPTPTSLHRPGYQGDKAAFLAPFDAFYDALNDSKQLKMWLGDQLHKSQALVQSLTLQQEKMAETIDALVEKKVSGIKAEMTGLKRRVEDLEDALYRSQQQRRESFDHHHHQQKQQHFNNQQHLQFQHQNGVVGGPLPEVAPYTFPAVSDPSTSSNSSRLRPELTRRTSSPGWQQQRGTGPNNPDRDRDAGGNSSPDARRISSSVQVQGQGVRQQQQPPPPPPTGTAASTSASAMHSPPQNYRERERAERDTRERERDRDRDQNLPPTPPSGSARITRPTPLSRHGSSHASGVPLPMLDRDSRERERENREREREWEREREREEQAASSNSNSNSASSRRVESRRNSVSMGDPEEETKR